MVKQLQKFKTNQMLYDVTVKQQYLSSLLTLYLLLQQIKNDVELTVSSAKLQNCSATLYST